MKCWVVLYDVQGEVLVDGLGGLVNIVCYQYFVFEFMLDVVKVVVVQVGLVFDDVCQLFIVCVGLVGVFLFFL